jgi:hypothetical protein
MKQYTLDGTRMSAAEFIRAMRKKYNYSGLIPVMLIDYKRDGDKGHKKNPNAPPEREYQMVLDAIKSLSPEELAQLKKETREKLVEQ